MVAEIILMNITKTNEGVSSNFPNILQKNLFMDSKGRKQVMIMIYLLIVLYAHVHMYVCANSF